MAIITRTYEFQVCRHRHRTANGYIITMTFNVPPNHSGQFSRRKLSTRCTGFQIRAFALDFRVRVLAAGGLNPSADCQALRAYKSAWEVYLSAAFACGLLDGEHGRDLRERLTHALGRCFA
jgi:hypothetical protein